MDGTGVVMTEMEMVRINLRILLKQLSESSTILGCDVC
jgi:hypothetical protein